MKKVFWSIIILLCFACTNPRNVKVDDSDARIHINKLKKDLDSQTSKDFEGWYKFVLSQGAKGKDGKVLIINMFSKKYEDLTLGDLLDKIEKRNKKNQNKVSKENEVLEKAGKATDKSQ